MSDRTHRTAVAATFLGSPAVPGHAVRPPRPGFRPRFDPGPDGSPPDDLRRGDSAPAQGTRVVTLEFEGTFDADGVVRARRALAQLSERDHLVLDLGKAHDVDWCALASLGAEFAALAPQRVSLTGYCGQHARLLAYLGFGALLRRPDS